MDIFTALGYAELAFAFGLMVGAGITRLVLKEEKAQIKSGFWTIKRKIFVISIALIAILGIAQVVIFG